MAEDEYEILVVRHGAAPTKRSDVYLNHKLYGEEDGPAPTHYYFWIIRNASRTVLVDTGFSARAAAERHKEVLLAPDRAYELLGVDTAAPHTLIVTHCHYDHLGNINLFPSSQILISAAELQFWKSEVARKHLIAYYAEDEELAALRRAEEEGRVNTFSGTTEVAPGIEIIEVGGHTPGQSMVRVATTEGPVLLASDAVHFHRELDDDMPFTAVTNLPDLYRGLETVRQMLKEGQVTRVLTGHDPHELDGLRRLEGPLGENVAVIGHATARTVAHRTTPNGTEGKP